MKRYFILIAFLLPISLLAQDDSHWAHIGPFSDGTSGFNPERVDCIAVDPRAGYQSYYYVGSRGGVWFSTNSGTTWSPMDPNRSMYFGGSSAMAVDPSSGDLFIASSDIDPPQGNTYEIYKKSFGTTAYSVVSSLPYTCLVHNLQFNPVNSNIIYACTTAGLFVSITKGATWSVITTTETFNVVFVPDGGTTYCFAAGNGIFMESSDGVIFTDNTAVESYLSSQYATFSNICTGDLTGTNKDMYIVSINSNVAGEYDVYKVTESAGSIVSYTYCTKISGDYDPEPSKLVIAWANVASTFMPLIFGGTSLSGWNTSSTAPTHLAFTAAIHADQRALINAPGSDILLSGSDGGFSASTYNVTLYHTDFSALNTGLDISQVNGFSGDRHDSIYVTGEQDAINGWLYNKVYDVVNSTYGSTEPSGCIINKFNNDTIIMNWTADGNNGDYEVSTNYGAGFSAEEDVYSAFSSSSINPPGSPFHESEEFGFNTYFEDPSRPGKIYLGANSLEQWDPSYSVFVSKMRPWTISPQTGWSTQTSWYNLILGGAISPIYKNGFYMTLANLYNVNGYVPAQVVKFVGPDIDDCWTGHNEDATHWNEITPDLSTISFPFGFSALGTNGVYQFFFPAVVVSTWNPNKIWVACSPVPNNPGIKVLQYDNGNWTDFSTGISQNEDVVSMVMEIGTNDQMYLGTNRAIYYRNANMSSWQIFDNDIPYVIIKQMEINYTENTIRAGTYGRGIWLSNLECPTASTLSLSNTTNSEFDEVGNYISSTANITSSNVLSDGSQSMVNYRAGDYVSLQTGFRATTGSNFTAFIHPCSTPGNSFIHSPEKVNPTTVDSSVISMRENYRINVYPNPNGGSFTLRLPENEISEVHVYNLLGSEIYTNKQLTDQVQIDLSDQPKGIYFIKAINSKTGETDVKRVLIQ
ncbi:MAG TPA: T9SS type A sorting domain-containing protein [Bacteroidia bacterium]|jgi:hypothetical protein|nr:T9SS type A sorting domain-containing protein [Bacteroidia bacterium]